jgi:hypothetical protein
MMTLGRLRFLMAYATPSRYPEALFLHVSLSELVTRLGSESGSMTSAKAVLGCAFRILTMAIRGGKPG